MEKQKQKETEKIIKILRYAIGLFVFVWLLWLSPTIAGQGIIPSIIHYTVFPFSVVVSPAAIIGLYFLVTMKLRMRLDIVLLLLLVFSLWNLQIFTMPQKPSGDISGNAKLEVTLVTEDNTPIPNVEVDLGEKPGTPPIGGRELTNSQGAADFSVKPGTYFIYFSDGDFPRDKMEPIDLPAITAEEGKLNTKTVILNSK